MAATRCCKKTIKERAQKDPEFVRGLLSEAALLSQSGESEAAKIILRDLFNAKRTSIDEITPAT
ncbi:hypothetical protein [Pseudomonas sp. NPDC088444]|uniref:hypothetical protein n=1 Tax=Pseudomonas sp. NPDC088444 TaxID=3364456 RepID=UPI00384BD865